MAVSIARHVQPASSSYAVPAGIQQRSIACPPAEPTGHGELVKIHSEPDVWLVEKFISDEEVAHIFSIAQNWKQSQAPKAHPDGSARLSTDPESTEKDYRTSWSSVLQPGQSPTLERIEKRLAAMAGLPVEHLECLALVRYAPGQQFKEHHDGRNRPKTIFLYLNDMPPGTGGETEFPVLGLRVRPQKGMAIMWNNTKPDGTVDGKLNHAGRPPKVGFKYGINCFFNEKVVRHGPSPTAASVASSSVAAPAHTTPLAQYREERRLDQEVQARPQIIRPPAQLAIASADRVQPQIVRRYATPGPTSPCVMPRGGLYSRPASIAAPPMRLMATVR
mmetsp:Transcript_21926/g.51257  ORF Transcript_21926/g.51257 Transcript_21926/m.51257 type:complete len:333 (-) Transcript_21926:39-1037(-)